MPTLQDAIALAVEAHATQKEKAGWPYILHPLRVMLRLETEVERIVGVLHDVVEDTKFTVHDLRIMGYPEEVLAALDCVTKRNGEGYEDFIERAAKNAVARRVNNRSQRSKLAPLCRPKSDFFGLFWRRCTSGTTSGASAQHPRNAHRRATAARRLGPTGPDLSAIKRQAERSGSACRSPLRCCRKSDSVIDDWRNICPRFRTPLRSQ